MAFWLSKINKLVLFICAYIQGLAISGSSLVIQAVVTPKVKDTFSERSNKYVGYMKGTFHCGINQTRLNL